MLIPPYLIILGGAFLFNSKQENPAGIVSVSISLFQIAWIMIFNTARQIWSVERIQTCLKRQTKLKEKEPNTAINQRRTCDYSYYRESIIGID